MKEDTVMVQCRFDLTDVEVAAAARKRGNLETQITQLDADFNVQKEKHKAATGRLDAEAQKLAGLIRQGYELRDAECQVVYDYDAGLVNTVRLDTGEVVKFREMTESEKGKGRPLPLGPAILLDKTDPDVQAAEEAVKDTEGAAAVTKAPGEDAIEAPTPPGRQYVPDDPAGVTAPAGEGDGTTLKHPSYPSPDDVCLCDDLRSDHHPATGCDLCECESFRDSDPLGVAYLDPEKREAEL